MDRPTVEVYDRSVAQYETSRPPRSRPAAQQFAGQVLPGRRCLDVGSGPGSYLPDLPPGTIALDASGPMLRRAREAAPDTLAVQADIEMLPFRDGALGGAWARNSYVHVARPRLPAALARLHRALAEGAPVMLTTFIGDDEGTWSDDDLPGRFFSRWSEEEAKAVVAGAGFAVERAEIKGETLWLAGRRDRTLPDFVGPDMRILVCGLNPSLVAADAGFGYAGATNRFWSAVVEAGLVSKPRDPLRALEVDRIGMTDLVKRATPGVGPPDGPTNDEYRAGAHRVARLNEWLRPHLVLFVGLTGYRAAVDRRAAPGLQPEPFGGAAAYVMPSTSGRNAHVGFAELVRHMRAAADLTAGTLPSGRGAERGASAERGGARPAGAPAPRPAAPRVPPAGRRRPSSR